MKTKHSNLSFSDRRGHYIYMTLLGAASILNPGIITVRPFVRTLLAYKTPSSSPADAWAKVGVKFKKNTLELWRSYESAPKQAK